LSTYHCSGWGRTIVWVVTVVTMDVRPNEFSTKNALTAAIMFWRFATESGSADWSAKRARMTRTRLTPVVPPGRGSGAAAEAFGRDCWTTGGATMRRAAVLSIAMPWSFALAMERVGCFASAATWAV
jgi:hypothetical protein